MSERARYWRRVLAEWKRSGLSQAAFCRERDITYVTFAWWKRKLNGVAGKKRRADTAAELGSETKRTFQKARRAMARFVEIPLDRSYGDGPEFVPSPGPELVLSSEPELVPTPGYEVVFPGGPTLRLPRDFDPQQVTRLVVALQSSC